MKRFPLLARRLVPALPAVAALSLIAPAPLARASSVATAGPFTGSPRGQQRTPNGLATSREEIEALLRRFQRAQEDGDEKAVAAHIDYDWMLKGLEFGHVPAAQREVFLGGLKQGIGMALLGDRSPLAGGDLVLRDLRPTGTSDEVMAIVRLATENRSYLYTCWWIHVGEGRTPRFYDWQSLDSTLRVRDGLAAMQGIDETLALALATHQQASTELWSAVGEDDEARARAHLRRIAKLKLPAYMESERALIEIQVEIYFDQPTRALELLDDGAVRGFDAPIFDYERAFANFALELYEPCLVAARRYDERIGGDPQIRELMGDCLLELGREQEARSAYESALDADPARVEALIGLAELAAPRHFDALRRRFRECEVAADWFDALANTAIEREEHALLALLVDELEAERPRDVNVAYYRAIWLSQAQGRPVEGAKLVLSVLERAAGEAYAFRELFLDLCLEVEAIEDQPAAVWAYRALPAADDADFGYLADTLAYGPAEALGQLIEAHAERSPDSPALPGYRGHLAALEGRIDEADERFAQAVEEARDEDEQGAWLAARIANLLENDRLEVAYREVEPREGAWIWILDQLYYRGESDALERALALRRAEFPRDPELPAWDALVAWYRGDLEAAAQAFDRADLALERFTDWGYDWELNEAAARTYLRADRLPDALKCARRVRAAGDPLMLAIVRAAQGRDAAAAQLLDEALAFGYTREEFAGDLDLAPFLGREKLLRFRP